MDDSTKELNTLKHNLEMDKHLLLKELKKYGVDGQKLLDKLNKTIKEN